MPIPGGTSGAHDDDMHQGSAKRDTANGLAGLGAGGQVLAPGSDIELTRDGSEYIEVVERTSGDIVYRWTRIGVNDFECHINCGGVACKILNDSLVDTINGIAELDGIGNILGVGPDVSLVRDATSSVRIVERTSGETAFRVYRPNANDYEAFILESNINKRVITDGSRDILDGFAGLDGSVKQVVDQHVLGGIAAEGTQVFNAALTAANTWQNLDVSAVVGSRHAMGIMSVLLDNGADANQIEFYTRQEGSVRNYQNIGLGVLSKLSRNMGAYIIFITDNNGVIEIKGDVAAVSDVITLNIVGWIGLS